ncbi:MAG: DUF2865 domain-containing protein [Hyphomicrobium sp.]
MIASACRRCAEVRLRALILGLLALTQMAATAEAQFFTPGWSGLGGGGAVNRSVRLRSPAISSAMRAMPALRAFSRWSPAGSRSMSQRPSDDDRDDWNGSYRTLCVRLCDGFFFPISHRVGRGRMYRDAKICEASCDCETRLFYLPTSSSDIKHASDLSGQSYGRIENAFAYRRTVDRSCTCKPYAWAASERVRHEEYRLEADAERAEMQERKGEALMSLAEREDAREAEEVAARLAKAAEKAEKSAAARRPRPQAEPARVAAAPAPDAAILPTEVATALVDPQATMIEAVAPLGEPPELSAAAIPATAGSGTDAKPPEAAAVIPDASTEVGVQPEVRRPPGLGSRAGAKSKRASKAARRSGPKSGKAASGRGFMQL